MTVVSLRLDASMEECDGISYLEWGVFSYKTVAVLDFWCGLGLLDHFEMDHPDVHGGESVRDVNAESVIECLEYINGASYAGEISKLLCDEVGDMPEDVSLVWTED